MIRTELIALLCVSALVVGSTAQQPAAGESASRRRDPAPTRESTGQNGPYQVARLRERDGLRDGPDYRGATIYFPKNARPPLAGIVIAPGYLAPERAVAAWGPFFASHGIVTMTIGTNRRNAAVARRSVALLDAVKTLRAEHRREGSPLFGKLDGTRVGVSGWSMGGGGAQLAARKDPTLACVLALCPWNPTRSRRAFEHSVPVLILGGERDPVAAVDRHAVVHYRRTPSTTPKAYFEVKAQGHFAANSPRVAGGDVGRVALSWLKVFLEGDHRYRKLLLDAPATASRYETNLGGRWSAEASAHSGPIVALRAVEGRLWSASRAGLVDRERPVWRPENQRVFDFVIGSGRFVAVGGRPGQRGSIWSGVLSTPATTVERRLGSDVSYAVALDDATVRAVVGGADGRVSVYSLPALERVRDLRAHTAACRAIAFHGRRLVTGGHDGSLHLYREDLSAPPRVIAAHSDKIECVLWSEAGRLVLSGAMDGRVCVHSAETGRLVRTYHRLGAAVLCLARGADDTWFAGLANGRLLRLGADAARVRLVRDVEEPIHALAVNGEELVLGLSGGRPGEPGLTRVPLR